MRDALHPELDRARDVIAAHRYHGVGSPRKIRRAATYLAMNGDAGDRYAASDAMREIEHQSEATSIRAVCIGLIIAAIVGFWAYALITSIRAVLADDCGSVETCTVYAEDGL